VRGPGSFVQNDDSTSLAIRDQGITADKRNTDAPCRSSAPGQILTTRDCLIAQKLL